MKPLIEAGKPTAFIRITAILAVAAAGFSGSAYARDNVFWSLGVGSPGVEVNVGNAFPVYVQPQPVYVQPPPVYIEQQPLYIQPPPRYYRGPPPVVYVQPEYRDGRYKNHHRGRDHDDDDYQD